MSPRLSRPRFFELFLEDAASNFRERGYVSLLPWWVIGCGLIGAVAAYFIADEFLANLSLAVAVYAGLLTFNGLMIALCWGAFAKIYEIVCSGSFSRYLHDNNMLSVYLFHITYVHIAQIAAVVVSVLSLVACTMKGLPPEYARSLFGVTVACTAYAIKEAGGAVTIMNDLIWYRSTFDAHQENSSNVKPFPNVKG